MPPQSKRIISKTDRKCGKTFEKLEDAKRQSVLSLQNIKEGILNKQTKKRSNTNSNK